MLLLVALFSLTGARAQQSLPYSYGFEDNDLSVDGWTTSYQGSANASDFGINSAAAQNGSYGFRFSSYNRDNVTYDQYLISPELSSTGSFTVQFSYKASSSNGTETFKVGYSTTDTNPSNFTFGDEISTNNTSWTLSDEFTFPAGTKYVAIWYYSDYQYRLYVDDFIFEPAGAVAKPTGLEVIYEGGTEAKVRWISEEEAFDIEVNGEVTENVGNGYVLTGLELATTYTIRVRAKNGTEVSNWSSPVSFTTDACLNPVVVKYTLSDSYGDGWNGNYILVYDEDDNPVATLTIESGASKTESLRLCGSLFTFYWYAGSYPTETSWTFTDADGNELFSGTGSSDMATGDVLYELDLSDWRRPTDFAASQVSPTSAVLSWTENSPTPATSWIIAYIADGDEDVSYAMAESNPFTLEGLTPETSYQAMVSPYNDEGVLRWSDVITFMTGAAFPVPNELAASHVTATSANISWTGSADSYNLRYGQTGEAKSQDFEESSLGEWTTIDADGDGYGWVLGSNVGGVYLAEGGSLAGNGYNDSQDLIVSGSYSNVSGVGALTPDNYLVSPKVKLGGSISFWAKGQDANYPSEVFGVAVSTTDNTNASSFTMVGANKTATGNWVQYTFNLSAYSGEGYVAIRHYNVSDQFMLDIDDIVITEPADNWTEITGITANSYELTGLNPETDYEVQVQAVYADGESGWTSSVTFTTASPNDAPTELAATDVKATSATLDWAGSQESYTLQYRHELAADPTAPATIIFTVDDVWGDGSGYQMLLDADATAYGTIIPETGGLTTSGDASAATYAEFEYKIPENADGALTTENIVIDNSIIIQIPAGTYDWCITNPTADDRMWIASGNGNVGGRYDDYVFEAAKTYEFHVYLKGTNDATDVTITRPMSEWTVVENVTAPYEFTGLTPESYYEWQVQGILSDGTTEWSELSSFTTPEITTIPVTISSVGYSTLYYGTLNLQVPAGVTASTYSYADSKIQVSKTYNEGEVIPAGTGVVLEANAGTYDFVVTTEAGEADANNALRGSDEAEQTTGGDVYYALSLKDGANIGFYWMAEGGAAFTNGAHKAYLALTNTKVKGFAIGLEDDATAIETIANGQQTTEGAIYNVAGQRLNKTQQGVNIVNGKKIAIK